MKAKKNRFENNFEDDDDERIIPKTVEKRRPIRNWKKAYTKLEDDAEDYDDFYE